MKKLMTIMCFLLTFSVPVMADFDDMLKAAESGDSLARLIIAKTYYIGEYRDGTKIGKNMDLAFAWAMLAYFQGEPSGEDLASSAYPKLKDPEEAKRLTRELFDKYGAEKLKKKELEKN